ncbi:flavin reductase family protein [Nocardioides bigeumensis]|uniref:Flavin reductase like domain-containing protein n=1 Tax=Nocardioides bigeumensis TaxID=433657 RepID=A0ABP5KH63_9ACTN
MTANLTERVPAGVVAAAQRQPIAGTTVASGESFRAVFGTFPTGVTIVTCSDHMGLPVGMTVSAVTALSLDPPQLLVCLQRGKYTLDAICESGRFGVNFLCDDQSLLSARFASNRFDKFTGVSWTPGYHTGAPRLDGVLAFAECVVQDIVESGDHQIVIGTMVAGRSREGSALVYWNRAYHRLVRQVG